MPLPIPGIVLVFLVTADDNDKHRPGAPGGAVGGAGACDVQAQAVECQGDRAGTGRGRGVSAAGAGERAGELPGALGDAAAAGRVGWLLLRLRTGRRKSTPSQEESGADFAGAVDLELTVAAWPGAG
jgi:hypothetical protein